MLPAGAKAPEFSLQSSSGDEIALADFRGKPVILAFYPADWSPVCGDQLTLYNEVLPIFEELQCPVVGDFRRQPLESPGIHAGSQFRISLVS